MTVGSPSVGLHVRSNLENESPDSGVSEQSPIPVGKKVSSFINIYFIIKVAMGSYFTLYLNCFG